MAIETIDNYYRTSNTSPDLYLDQVGGNNITVRGNETLEGL